MKYLALTLPSLSPLTSGWRQRFFLLLSIKPTWGIIWHWFRGSWKGVRYHQWKWLPLRCPICGQFAQLFHHLLHLRNRPGCRFIRSHSLRERSCTWSNTLTWWLDWGGGACRPQSEIAGKQSCQFPKASPIGHDLQLQVNAWVLACKRTAQDRYSRRGSTPTDPPRSASLCGWLCKRKGTHISVFISIRARICSLSNLHIGSFWLFVEPLVITTVWSASWYVFGPGKGRPGCWWKSRRWCGPLTPTQEVLYEGNMVVEKLAQI